jgi:hypothetical protein
MARRIVQLVMLAGVVGGLAGCAGAVPSPSALASLSADQIVAQIALTASAEPPSLVATGAIADFGIEEGVRLVTVRIVQRLQISVRIRSPIDITFAEAPTLCLVGPDSAPDDAGLTDPCWGSPDLSAALAQDMPKSSDGRPMLRAGQALEVSAALERGDVRCDYPPGRWTLGLSGRPLVNGQAAARSLEARPAAFFVSIPADEAPLAYLKTDQTRYCGLATVVYREQGEPPLATP